MHGDASGEQVTMAAVSRGQPVLRLQRSTNTYGDCLLADSSVQESRELARLEEANNCLFKYSDPLHLAEEIDDATIHAPLSSSWLIPVHAESNDSSCILMSFRTLRDS